jgi:hypothetical protein
MTRAHKQTGTSRDTFTRYRAVEYLAKTYLLDRGYHVVLSAGEQSPLDLVAWRCSGQHILVKAERSRRQIHNLAEVTTQYRGDIDALRAMALPSFAQRQLWVWHLHTGWRFFDIMAGGISEVADDV